MKNLWDQKPESHLIKNLIDRFNRGLKITGKVNDLIRSQLNLLVTQSNFDRVLTLLHILNLLFKSEDNIPLASLSYRITNKKSEIDKLDKIYACILDNSTRRIGLSEIAAEFNMSRTGLLILFLNFLCINDISLKHPPKHPKIAYLLIRLIY